MGSRGPGREHDRLVCSWGTVGRTRRGRGFQRAGRVTQEISTFFVRLETNYRTKRFENSPSKTIFCGNNKSSRKNLGKLSFLKYLSKPKKKSVEGGGVPPREAGLGRGHRQMGGRQGGCVLLFRHLIACRPPEVTKGEQRGFLLLPQCASCRSVSWETRLAHPAAQAKAGPKQRKTDQLQRPITSRHHRGTVGAWSNRKCL